MRELLRQIDGKGYKAYRRIRGSYDWHDYELHVDYIQPDPFATPSRVRVAVPLEKAAFPPDVYKSKIRTVALCDYLTRKFDEACRRYSRGKRGSGHSGVIAIERPGQEVLERNCMVITADRIEARFAMGLPARGRRITAKLAEEMFFVELPRIVRASLFFKSLNPEELYRHIETVEDAEYLRSQLGRLGLVAFVADGSILPRASGVDPRPMSAEKAVPFRSPPSMRVRVHLPNRGEVTGMGIPRGVTLIVGGGYHGKSTLLRALELGIYNHIPGDGRELVVTDPTAVKIRAEDGRRVECVDISPFVSRLPQGTDTKEFSTENASGSTSQAANIVEALEAGARVLLIDEDTSATNFMVRDARMQELVPKRCEPITPFIDRVRQLYEEHGVSTILVMGGCGDYFDVADRVLCMVDYVPHDVTREATKIAKEKKTGRRAEAAPEFDPVLDRIPAPGSLDPRGKKVRVKGLHTIKFGATIVDLSSVEQLVEIGQTKAIAEAMLRARRLVDGKRSLREIVDIIMGEISERGLDVLGRADLAAFRAIELAAAVNRLRTLKIKRGKPSCSPGDRASESRK